MKRSFNKMILAGLVLGLANCAGPNVGVGGQMIYETTPGTALPSPNGISICHERDRFGRCSDWSNKSNSCVNPKGVGEVELLVLCNEIKDGKWVPAKKAESTNKK